MSQPAAPDVPGVPPQNAAQPGGPGTPPPPGGFGPMPGAPAPAKRGMGRVIGIVVAVVVVVAVVIAVGLFLNRNDPDNAKVGSCMAGQSEDSLKVVDCAKDHDWTVIGKVEDKSQSDFNADNTGDLKLCAQYPGTEAEFWKGDSKGGYVLCLKSA